MNVVFSLILLAAALGCIVFLPTSAAVRTMAVSCSI